MKPVYLIRAFYTGLNEEEPVGKQNFTIYGKNISQNDGLPKTLRQSKAVEAFNCKIYYKQNQELYCENGGIGYSDRSNINTSLNEKSDYTEKLFSVQSNFILNGLDGLSRCWALSVLDEIEESNKKLRAFILKGLYGLSRCWAESHLYKVDESLWNENVQKVDCSSYNNHDQLYDSTSYTSDGSYQSFCSDKSEILDELDDSTVSTSMYLYKSKNDSKSDLSWGEESPFLYIDESDEDEKVLTKKIYTEPSCKLKNICFNKGKNGSLKFSPCRNSSDKQVIDKLLNNPTGSINFNNKNLSYDGSDNVFITNKEEFRENLNSPVSYTIKSNKDPLKTRKRSSVENIVRIFNSYNASTPLISKNKHREKRIKNIDRSKFPNDVNKTNQTFGNSIENKNMNNITFNRLKYPKDEEKNFKFFDSKKSTLNKANYHSEKNKENLCITDSIVHQQEKNEFRYTVECNLDSNTTDDPATVLLNVVEGRNKDWVKTFIKHTVNLLKESQSPCEATYCHDILTLKDNFARILLEKCNKNKKSLDPLKVLNKSPITSTIHNFGTDNNLSDEKLVEDEISEKLLKKPDVNATYFNNSSEYKELGISYGHNKNERKIQSEEIDQKNDAVLDNQHIKAKLSNKLDLRQAKNQYKETTSQIKSYVADPKNKPYFSNKSRRAKSLSVLREPFPKNSKNKLRNSTSHNPTSSHNK